MTDKKKTFMEVKLEKELGRPVTEEDIRRKYAQLSFGLAAAESLFGDCPDESDNAPQPECSEKNNT